MPVTAFISEAGSRSFQIFTLRISLIEIFRYPISLFISFTFHYHSLIEAKARAADDSSDLLYIVLGPSVFAPKSPDYVPKSSSPLDSDTTPTVIRG